MRPGLLLFICALLCEPDELFLHLVLTARPSKPIEGSSLTLTCETRLLLQPPPVQPQFSFFRDGHNRGSERSSSPKLQIPTVWKEDSGTYWCTMTTAGNKPPKQSQSSYIQVQRIPVSDVSLETQPPGGQVMKGDKLVLICSVAKGTGNITFVWYKGHLGLNLETKTQHSRTANFEVAPVTESDSDQYYCAADNGHGPSLSGLVDIAVRIPVSRPVLTLRAPRAQAEVGDVVELHCEALGGSPPILYQFYHEDVTLGNSSAPSGGGASFNLSLTAEHSGNYSCEADNGQGAQRSEAVTLNFTAAQPQVSPSVPAEPRGEHLTSGVVEGLLGSLGLITAVLLLGYWLKRKIERCSTRDPHRSHSSPEPQEPNYLNSPDPVQLPPVYENVNVMRGDDVYSLVYHVQQEQESGAAEHMRTQVENKVSADIYSRLRKANIADVDYDDTT
ncbi:Fc receptor-like protein 1 isoform X1 [Marmota monax]|uniref:Fc receptor-like protein 1 isoform X1 n=2 Tax=Marmota monax TaxID=9995 RepID=UPI001EB00B1D|nr:Fc receptor-like protein 1 isoform X1 [Marmota monax]